MTHTGLPSGLFTTIDHVGIAVPDLDEAIAWARKIPMPGGKVEVRPVMDYEAAGSGAHSNAAEARR